jgi:dihydrofolate synthase/folylpolyglutamate synthase
VQRLLQAFRQLYMGGGPDARAAVLLFAAAAGKRVEEMAAVLAPAFADIVVTTPGSFRESEPERVFQAFAARNPATVVEADPARALKRALQLAEGEPSGGGPGGPGRPASRGVRPLLVTGSFYLVGEIRRLLLRPQTASGGGQGGKRTGGRQGFGRCSMMGR